MGNPLLRIELEEFSNRIALDMGLTIVDFAKEKNLNIAVKIERINYDVFLYVDDEQSENRHTWLYRKAKVAKHFEESSLAVKLNLEKLNTTLEKRFGLDEKEYLAKGGAIPIFVKNAGMVAIVTVSGLSDVEDHNVIVDALQGKYIH